MEGGLTPTAHRTPTLGGTFVFNAPDGGAYLSRTDFERNIGTDRFEVESPMAGPARGGGRRDRVLRAISPAVRRERTPKERMAIAKDKGRAGGGFRMFKEAKRGANYRVEYPSMKIT